MQIECEKPNRCIHVCYHGQDHYDSVRALDDDGQGIPIEFELLAPPIECNSVIPSGDIIDSTTQCTTEVIQYC